MRCLLVVLCCAATTLAAQEPVPAPADSARVDSQATTPPLAPLPPPPPPPTPEQERYLRGLRAASRGVAQLKDGVDRVRRTRSTRDTVAQRQAGRRLGGLCTAARSFMANGRSQMQPTVYEDTTRVYARRVALYLDSLIGYVPTCARGAGQTPDKVAGALGALLRSYDAALRNFRAAVGLPNRP